jgi:MFS family permease
VWTFGEMIAMPAMSAFVSEIAPPKRRGLYMSTLMLAFGTGCTLGPKAGLALLDRHGAVALWIAVGAVGLLGAWLYSRLPQRSAPPAE